MMMMMMTTTVMMSGYDDHVQSKKCEIDFSGIDTMHSIHSETEHDMGDARIAMQRGPILYA
eukprot:716459-Karenia_brevis.AAC.1